MKILYKAFNFRTATLNLITQANDIITEYFAEDYKLTLRQLYYQFVARGIILNKEKEYKRLGGVINDGRLAGTIDWDAIVDRTRKIQINSHWDEPSEIIQSAANSYAIDTRATQDNYVEVWVEKEALAGILARVCEPLDVPYFSCKGYTSQSAMWRAACRIENKLQSQFHKKATILHLGDHDPSGIDMTNDIDKRLNEVFGVDTKIKRIALTMNQIGEYEPPPNPAKITDSRYHSYAALYGEDSWELDALDPRTINDLITKEIKALTDLAKQRILVNKQEKQREKLQSIADNFDKLHF